jgi:formate hydrogenlyase subunit 6/NADH:ubiquinone oxidoreductase subunit I
MMSRLRPLAHLLPELVRTLFSRRVTVRFPFESLELPDYFRGRVVIEPELCGGCGLCVRDCPAFALELEHEDRERFRLIHYHDRCAYCGQCADSCRQGAIVLVNEFVQPMSQRDALAQVVVERDADQPVR